MTNILFKDLSLVNAQEGYNEHTLTLEKDGIKFDITSKLNHIKLASGWKYNFNMYLYDNPENVDEKWKLWKYHSFSRSEKYNTKSYTFICPELELKDKDSGEITITVPAAYTLLDDIKLGDIVSFDLSFEDLTEYLPSYWSIPNVKEEN